MMDLVLVPGGTFTMGSTGGEVADCVEFWSSRLVEASFTAERFRTWIEKEQPAHAVTVEPFSISRFPVTNAQFAVYCAAAGLPAPDSLAEGFPGDHPVWGVGFEQAKGYAAWLSSRAGRAFRLPTEVEWEFSARGFLRRDFPYGQVFDSARANTAESGIGKTTPVDRYERWASPFGVCDLAGNVEEWVDSLYRPYPGGAFIKDDLVDRLGESYPVLRGGSFARGGDLARCARRHGPYPSPAYRYTGFRLVCVA